MAQQITKNRETCEGKLRLADLDKLSDLIGILQLARRYNDGRDGNDYIIKITDENIHVAQELQRIILKSRENALFDTSN